MHINKSKGSLGANDKKVPKNFEKGLGVALVNMKWKYETCRLTVNIMSTLRTLEIVCSYTYIQDYSTH